MKVHTATSTVPWGSRPGAAADAGPGTGADAGTGDDDGSSGGGSGPERDADPENGEARQRARGSILDPAQRVLRRERRRRFRRDIQRAIRQDELVQSLTEAMLGTVLAAKKERRRSQRMCLRVSFREGMELSSSVEYDEDEAPKRITDPTHVSEDHNDIPWDEWEAEPLTNWWDQPDLHEDDEVTKLCKRVLIASASKDIGEGNIEIKADKIHALVIKFVLKVQQRAKERGRGKPGENLCASAV